MAETKNYPNPKPKLLMEAMQITILLNDTEPSIWRRILIDTKASFFELHTAIQLTMGWKNRHMFEFRIAGYRIGKINDDGEPIYGFGDDEIIDSEITMLQDILSGDAETFTYWYDFGDNWHHTINVDKTVIVEDDLYLPSCIGGKQNCPPEDCGGISSFYDLLAIIKDTQHGEHRSMLEWLGGSYDPDHFELYEANEKLDDIDSYLDLE